MIDFVETNAETIINELISDFEEYTGDKLYPADPRRQFLQGFGYVLNSIYNAINATGRSNLLSTAVGEGLDGLGELSGTKRLQPSKASVNIKFTLSAAQATDIIIPKGTRVTPDGILFFSLKEDLKISSGETTATAVAEAAETGEEYNGFLVGQIDKLVDGNPYVKSVENTGQSAGGSDVEGDEKYRERIRMSPYAYSTAGPEMAYVYFALSASPEIEDVKVKTESDSTVNIYVIKKGGVIPEAGDEVLQAVKDTLSNKSARPLTDKIEVKAPVAKNTALTATYYISGNDISKLSEIQSRVNEAAQEYKLWQTEKIGRDINPDELKKMVLNAGAARIDITAPVFTVVGDAEVAQITAVNLTYGGTIDV